MNSSPAKARGSAGKEDEKDMWSSLLDNVSSGRRLPEKTVIVLGGSPELQRDFLGTLDSEAVRKPQDRNRQKPPVANDFAMGFTYQDVLDADQEDILARLSIYTLPEPPDAFMPLTKPLLTAKTIPESLLILLLDWTEPWNWLRQICDRLRLVQQMLKELDDEAKQVMNEIMQDWQQKRRGPLVDGSTQAPNEPNVNVPLGSGEWDEALGLPLCVVCHGIEKMDTLEKEHNWRDEDFYYIASFLRTVLLKHGGSLIYTANTSPNSLPTLVQSTLGIQSLLKRNPLKHNVVDHEKTLIPPNWDSWGKIKVNMDGFDVEGVSEAWSLEVQPVRPGQTQVSNGDVAKKQEDRPQNAPTRLYEETIRDPYADTQLAALENMDDRGETKTPSMQEFLATQQEAIDRLKKEDEANAKDDPKNMAPEGSGYADNNGRVNEHIGPVQFNMGGIQVDADDALLRLRRGREDTPETEMARTKSGISSAGTATPSETKVHNEQLASFFAGLVKRGASASPRPPP